MSVAADDPAVSDEELLAVFARRDEDALLDREVAAGLPLSTEAVEERLNDLYERGDLERVDDPRGEAWRLADDVDSDRIAPEPETETSVERTELTDETEPSPDHAGTAPEPETRPVDPAPGDPDVEDAIAAFDPPGDAAASERGREALRSAYLYLRKRETARAEDFERDVYPEFPAGYDEFADWWEEVVSPGLEAVPNVTRTEDDGWRFVDAPDDRP